MSAVKKQTLIPEQDYLAGELDAPVRHEYLGGYVHAMAGNSNRHSIIETMETVIPLPEIGIDLTLSEIYDEVEFAPEQDLDDSNPIDV